jgi:hypothetical protein
MTMRGVVRRVTGVVGAAAVALGMAAGAANASEAAVLNWSPAGTFDYGTLSPGQTAPAQTFTLTNSGRSGTSALKIALTVTTGPPSAFAKTADTCTGISLGPKTACHVTVTYTAPATSQTDQATLTVTGKKSAVAASVTLTGASAKASPTLTTALSPGGTAGTVALNDTATLLGGMSPSGTITFNLYDPSQSGCTGNPVYTQTETVSGDGSYPTANTALAAEAGAWNWTVTYSGDAGNNPATSPCGAESAGVTPAAPAGLSLSGSGSPIAGVPFPVTVTVLDAFGNVVTGFTGTVHLTSSDPFGILPADYTFAPGDDGVHTFFGVILTKAGPQTVTAIDTSNPAIIGSELVAVNPAAPAILGLSAPSSAVTGAAFPVTVTVEDPYGNPETDYTGTVHFTSSDSLAVLPADYTFTPGDGGTHTFSVTLDTEGSQSITAADTVNSALSHTVTVSVSPGCSLCTIRSAGKS